MRLIRQKVKLKANQTLQEKKRARLKKKRKMKLKKNPTSIEIKV
jgi:hypothetical protein